MIEMKMFCCCFVTVFRNLGGGHGQMSPDLVHEVSPRFASPPLARLPSLIYPSV